METVSTCQPRPTTEDLHRLAAPARARGRRLTQEQPTVWYCSSATRPDPHYVTGLSGDCRGFQEHQRCTHYALLLDHLGWLPKVEAEDAKAPALTLVPCWTCSGGGVVSVQDCNRVDWPHPPCPVLHGRRRDPAAVTAP
jgi:hypothetical protein